MGRLGKESVFVCNINKQSSWSEYYLMATFQNWYCVWCLLNLCVNNKLDCATDVRLTKCGWTARNHATLSWIDLTINGVDFAQAATSFHDQPRTTNLTWSVYNLLPSNTTTWYFGLCQILWLLSFSDASTASIDSPLLWGWPSSGEYVLAKRAAISSAYGLLLPGFKSSNFLFLDLS